MPSGTGGLLPLRVSHSTAPPGTATGRCCSQLRCRCTRPDPAKPRGQHREPLHPRALEHELGRHGERGRSVEGRDVNETRKDAEEPSPHIVHRADVEQVVMERDGRRGLRGCYVGTQTLQLVIVLDGVEKERAG
eukprot:410524-Hanusia_phi.AAC.2